MKILFLGDIVGKSGRDKISSLLNDIKNDNNIDLTVANGENAAHGKGITLRIYDELLKAGIDVITMGNHSFSKKIIFEQIDEMNNLVLPINQKENIFGHKYIIMNINNMNILITNILGDILMNDISSDPYEAMDELLNDTKDLNIDIYFVDMHAETTAEKRLFAEYYKDKIDICVGTHTHVQTADEQMIGDLAYISDVGMCGPFNSVIGRDIDELISNKIYKENTRYCVSENDAIICGVIIEIDDLKKKVINISRLQIRPN